MKWSVGLALSLAMTLLLHSVAQSATAAEPVRVGILAFDNYQSLAFTQVWHKPPADNPDAGGLKVVAAWRGGSPDIEETQVDIERWEPRLIEYGISIEDSIDTVLQKCDAVMIMTIDGRTHLKLAEHALKARKPTYIGRPMAASLEDVIAIFDLAEKYDTPVFSCSQHRYSPGFVDMQNHPEVGEVIGCDVFGGCPTVDHHPDLFWHAIHSFETLYTIMGPGAVSVTRTRTDDAELITVSRHPSRQTQIQCDGFRRQGSRSCRHLRLPRTGQRSCPEVPLQGL